MPRSLAKVQKKIKRKHGNATSLNENSRNSQRLRRAELREDKLARVSTAKAKSHQPQLKRVAIFQKAAREFGGPLQIARIQDLIQGYIHRDEEELSRLKKERRPGRPATTKEDLLNQRIAAESREYEIGFYIPDMEDSTNIQRLIDWNGEWTSLSVIKFSRLTRAGVTKEANFPPTGGK
ncbi:MAG: hypothetical protein M1837_002025 [Sclerophora amabilis]|nr:MAG: hypothetical protein M1837_002025 [Sclerophora amabilis]